MSKIIKVYRIFKNKHRNTANTGYGASLYPGRWNHRGVPMIYSSGTLALACLEIMANADFPLLGKYLFIEYQFKDALLYLPSRLPCKWSLNPIPDSTRDFGTEWVKSNRSAVLQVPSSVIPQAYNYLINPSHADFKHIKASPAMKFVFDDRFKAIGT